MSRTILTFSNIYDSDINLVGTLALDLVKASNIIKLVPPSFVIPTTFFDLEVKQKLEKHILAQISYDNSYGQKNVEKIFSALKFSEESIREFQEAYESLGVSENSDIINGDDPVVNIYLSPSYYKEFDLSKDVILNIKSFKDFLRAIKTLWFRFYSQSHVAYRGNNSIEEFSCALIVQKFVKIHKTATISTYINEIDGDAYLGLLDVYNKSSKDKFIAQSFKINEFDYKVNSQEYKLEESEKSTFLLKVYLKQLSRTQKLEEDKVQEILRLTKKLKQGMGSDISVVFSFAKSKFYMSLVQSHPTLQEPVNDLNKDDLGLVDDFSAPVIESEQDFDDLQQDINLKEDVDEIIIEKSDEQVYLHDDDELNIESDNLRDDSSFEENDELEILDDSLSLDNNKDLYEEKVESDNNFEVNNDDIYKEEEVVDESHSNLHLEEDLDEISFESEPEVNQDKEFLLGLEPNLKQANTQNDLTFEKNLQQEEDNDDFLLTEDHVDLDMPESTEDTLDKESLKEELEVSHEEILEKLVFSIKKLYKESFGLEPENTLSALKEINQKYSINNYDDLLDFLLLSKVKAQQGSVDEAMLAQTLISVKEFIKENV